MRDFIKRNRAILITATVVVAIPVILGGVLAYAASQATEIADGMTIGKIKVGGLNKEQARAKVREAWQTPLEKPILLTYKTRDFVLTAKQAHVKNNINEAVDKALEKTRAGNGLQRGWRELTGGRINEDIPLRAAFSPGAVDRMIAHAKSVINRPAVDAKLHIELSGITTTASQEGLALSTKKLREEILHALADPKASREFALETTVVKPKVSKSQLPTRYPSVLIVDKSKYQLSLYKNLQLSRTYPVAVGAEGYETPSGLFTIHSKQKDPIWNVPNTEWAKKTGMAGKSIPGGDPKNALKARWLGVVNDVGIHGTASVNSLGSAESHGCIRMDVNDVTDLYDRVALGSPIYIQ
jgi:lipoprotein-anchoring transpeptidase ErfK/SrfK